MSRHALRWLPIAGLALFAGCTRVAVTTTVGTDGAWTRQDVFTESKSNPGSSTQVSDTFVLPIGAGWKSTKSVSKDDVKYTSTLHVKGPAQCERDISVRRKGLGPVLVTNKVVVRQVSPGVWEYRETLHWKGAKPKELTSPPPDVIAALRSTLPANLASDATAKALAPKLIQGVWSAMFGPGQSILPTLLLQPDAAEHVLRQRVGRAVDQALVDSLGTKISAAERRRTVSRLVGAMADKTKSQSALGGGSKTTDSNEGTDLPSLTFTLKPPGRVIRTNGEVDEYANEVWWTLYPEAAALGDVVMTATWQSAPK